jgi:hypothetical protein
MPRLPAWLLLSCAVAAALLAQLLLSGWLTVVGYAVAAFLFFQATRADPVAGSTSFHLGRTTLLAGYALAVAVLAGWIVRTAQPVNSFPAWNVLLIGWLLGVTAYGLAWASPRALLGSLRAVWARHRLEIVLLLALLSVALLLRGAALDRFPRTMGGDDGQVSLRAREVLEGKIVSPFSTGGIALGEFPTLYFFAQAGLMRLFGDDVVGARMLSAVLGTGAVAALYALGRAWFGPAVGLAAASIMATLPYHLFWSRNPLNNVGDTLAVACFLLFTTRAFASGRPFDFAVAGLSLGIGQYAYGSVRVLIPVVAILVVREVLADRAWLRRNRMNLLILAGGLVVAYLPQAVYFVDHPNAFSGRFNQVSIFQSGWLEAEVQRSGQTHLQLIAEQLRRTFLVFSHTAPRGFFEPGRPILDPLSSVFLAFGAAYALVHIRERHCFALLLTTAALLGGLAMTDNQPNSARLVVATPLAVLLTGLGLVRSAEAIANRRALLKRIGVGAATAYAAAVGLQFYFFQYANQSNYDRGTGEAATELGYYMRQFPAGTRFLFLAQPGITSCGSHQSLRFIAPNWECVDVPPAASGAGPRPRVEDTDVVVALWGRRIEAEQMAAARGAARRREIRVEGRPDPLMVAYEPVN